MRNFLNICSWSNLMKTNSDRVAGIVVSVDNDEPRNMIEL